MQKHRGSSAETFVEIGHDWLKILRVERTRAGLVASNLLLEPLEISSAIAPERLTALLKEAGALKDRIYATIPRQMVTSRILELPSTHPAEIADMVELQIGRQTPHAKDEIVTAYKILGPGRKGYSRVMLAIVQRGILRARYSVLEEAGLKIARMTMGSEGLANWFRYISGVKSTSGVVVVDVDSFFSEVAIFENQQLVFSRSILIGANHLAADPAGASDRLMRDVKGALTTFHSESEGGPLDRVLLTGAALGLATLRTTFEEGLGLKVDALDSVASLKNLPATPNRKLAPFHTVSLTALAGMAASPETLDFNLIPDSVRLRREVSVKARNLSQLGIWLMLLLVLVSMNGMLRLFMRRSQLNSVRLEAAEVAPGAELVRSKIALIRAVGERVDTRTAEVNLLFQIQKSIPADIGVSLTRLDLDMEARRVVLMGSAPSTEAVRALGRALESVPILENIQETGETSIDPQTRRYRFNLTGSIKGGS